MRLALGGINHESNSFAPRAADLAAFAAAGILRGEEIIATHGDASSSVTGFLDVAGDDVEVVPLLYSFPWPSGPVTADAYEAVLSEFLDALRDRGPWDGVLLAQHGAAIAEHVDEADADMVARIREVAGASTPIVVALDLHANLTPALVANTSAGVLYRTNPHVDARERARQCGQILVDQVRGAVHPVQALLQIPLAIEVACMSSDAEPLRSILAEAEDLERQPGVLAVSIGAGHPYADVPALGTSALAVTDDDPALAERIVRRLGARLWEIRQRLVESDLPTVDDALRDADRGPFPVGLLDVGDNIGGGTPGDSVHVLRAALELGVSGVVAMIADAEAVARCVAAGSGGTVDVSIGGKADSLHGPPLAVRGTVAALTDGRSVADGPTHAGFRYFDAGPTAVIELANDNTVIVTTKVTPPFSSASYTAAGVDLSSSRIIVLKGVHSPRAAFASVVTRFVLADSPGATSAGITRLPFRRRARPLFPFEPDTAFDPATTDRLLVVT